MFLAGESQGRGSRVGCCLWGRTELDTTEATYQQQQQQQLQQQQNRRVRIEEAKQFVLFMEEFRFEPYSVAQRRRQWHPTPVPLPGKSHGWRSLVGYSPWGHKESDTTERLHFT